MSPQHIVLIPPNGQFKKQDFSLQRINKWLKTNKNISTTLVHIKPEFFTVDTSVFENVVEVSSKEEIFQTLKRLHTDAILHRSWMGNYDFAAQLVQKFDNVIVNIKDWNFASKEVYEFLYPDSKDHESIAFIFKQCPYILSHFTKEQSLLWAEEYGVNADKFIFFPEYCNESSFYDKPYLPYKNIHLVYAGALPPTSFAEDYFPGKAHLRSIKKLTQQKIAVDFVLPENVYETTFRSTELFKDFLYENTLNKYFNLVKGKALSPEVLDAYHFGFFELEASGLNHMLYKYAVTSKFAFYLEAGLPILINNKFISIANIVQEHKLGIVFDNADLAHFKDTLDISQHDYDSFIANIQRYRQTFTYHQLHLKTFGLIL